MELRFSDRTAVLYAVLTAAGQISTAGWWARDAAVTDAATRLSSVTSWRGCAGSGCARARVESPRSPDAVGLEVATCATVGSRSDRTAPAILGNAWRQDRSGTTGRARRQARGHGSVMSGGMRRASSGRPCAGGHCDRSRQQERAGSPRCRVGRTRRGRARHGAARGGDRGAGRGVRGHRDQPHLHPPDGVRPQRPASGPRQHAERVRGRLAGVLVRDDHRHGHLRAARHARRQRRRRRHHGP